MCERFYSWSSPFSHHKTTTNYNIEIHLAYTTQDNNNSVGWTLYLNGTKIISRGIMLNIIKRPQIGLLIALHDSERSVMEILNKDDKIIIISTTI